MSGWTADQIPDQAGRLVVVTGASSGLGLITARQLAAKGARVVLAVRSVPKGETAASRILAVAPDAHVEVSELDLSSLASIRAFADRLNSESPAVDLLINNAGIMMTPPSTTADGFELQFGTNHLGHFALTGLLLEALGRAGAARVVTVSSLEHRAGHIHFDDLQLEHGYTPRKAYQQSKMANAVFGIELDQRLRGIGSTVLSVLAHPGYSATNLQSTGPRGPMAFALRIGNALLAQNPEDGALPQLYAATAPGVQGGQFFGPASFGEMRGNVTEVQAVPEARDEEIGRRLWAVCEDLTGVTYL